MAAAAWTNLARKYWKAWSPVEDGEEKSTTEQAKSTPYFKWVVTAGVKASKVVGHSREAHAWAVAADRARLAHDLLRAGETPRGVPPPTQHGPSGAFLPRGGISPNPHAPHSFH